MLFRLLRRVLLPAIFLPASLGLAAPLDLAAADPELKVVRIDSEAKETFLGLALDSAGRLFVGGREAVWVYEPDPKGLYLPRRELFRFPKDSWVSDIVVRGADLLVLNRTGLHRLPGAVKARSGLKAERLLWGLPSASGPTGFHGLALGPEGDLYVQHGDPFAGGPADHLGHWTWFTADGKQTEFTGVGGVLRLKPDGSGLQVFARGMREGRGLAFDREWNLFSHDNGRADPAAKFREGRLLHAAAGADFAWPHGWLPESDPRRADVLPAVNASAGRAATALAYYHDTFLPEKYRHNLLLARAGAPALSRFPIERNGATFKAREFPLLPGGDSVPMGVAVGRGGRIFISLGHLAQTLGAGAQPNSLVMLTRSDDAPNAPFEAYEETIAPDAKLFLELNAPDWTRRQRAHLELRRRGGKSLKDATVFLAATKLGSPAMPHLVWLAAAGETQTAASLVAVLFDEKKNDALRLQAVRAAVEFRLGTPLFVLAALMRDDSPPVVHAALQAFSLLPGRVPDEVIEGPGRGTEAYLRQGAAALLAEQGARNDFEPLAASSNPARRLLGALAAGFRLTVPDVTNAPPASLQLAGGRSGSFAVADFWRATKAGQDEEATFALLKRLMDDPDERVRFTAAHFLHLLKDPRSEEQAAKILSAPRPPAKQP